MSSNSLFTKIILGTVQLGLDYGINNSQGKPNRKKAFEILSEAFSHNITTLDTADAYGDAIDIIGEYHRNNISKFDVISKFKITDNLDIKRHLEKSLKILAIEFLFGYLFHSFDELIKNKVLLKEIESIKKQHLIKKIGVSVYTNEQLEKAIEIEEIDIIQLPYNLLDNFNKRGDLILKAKKLNKIIHTRSVFLQGLFFKSPQELPQKLIPIAPYLLNIHVIAKKNNISLEELALGYVLKNDLIDGVLFGVETSEQLNRNIESLKRIMNSSIVFDDLIKEVDVKEIDLLNPMNWK